MFSPRFIAAIVALSLFTGCGYVFQGAKTPNLIREKLGIRRIYLASPKNLTYKPGVESWIYNEVQRAFKAGNRIELVQNRGEADAVLEGSIITASFVPNSLTSSGEVFPKTQFTIEVTVATEYLANLVCGFWLVQRLGPNSTPYGFHPPMALPKDEYGRTKEIWGTQLSRASRFLGNNQKGEFGTTSALINESEFDRTLQESARLIAQELHDSLLVMF